MIGTIMKIRGIGLLHDAIEKPTSFARVTTIFGENGRGKSTKSAIFSSLATGDGAPLIGRKTIGGTYQPEVALKIDTKFHEFKSGAWNCRFPDICVFDSGFADANVYSGFNVTSDHRRRLLDFALGETGVQLKQKVDELTGQISDAASNIRMQEAKLAGICRPLTVQQYLAIMPDSEIEKKIADAEKAVEVASKAKEISGQSKFAEVSMPKLDISGLAGLLSKSLSDISVEAKTKVTDHFSAHFRSHGEQWVKQGLALVKGEHCPFCGQPLAPARDLLDAYNVFFDQAYNNHLHELAAFRRTIEGNLADAHLANLNRKLGDNGTAGEFWKPLVNFPLPVSPADAIANKTRDARSKLMAPIERKLANPLAAVSEPIELDASKSLLQGIENLVVEYNDRVRQLNVGIEAVQKQAKASDLNSAKANIAALKRQKERHETPNKVDCEIYKTQVAQKRDLEECKEKARKELEQFTNTLLKKYEVAINGYLHTFGAEFGIVDVGTSNEGGLPRVNYKLQLGSHKIALGSQQQAQSGPVFANVLGDSDKRTLAFSFFLAKLVVDGKLPQQFVVVDDPVSSLDQSRRRATHRALRTLAGKANQLVVLSHDPLFIQSFSEDDDIRALGVTVLELRRGANNYTVLGACDIEERVQSEYKTNYRTLMAYVTEGEVVDKQKVVRAIRPMLEANLRHRFQDSLKGAYSLGKMIEMIRTCKPGDALEGMKSKEEDLDDINDFTTEFTHDSDTDGSLQKLDDAQLKNYAKRALAIARGT